MSASIEELSNQAFFDHITSDDPGLLKTAADNVNDYTRVKMREDGFLRRIMEPIPISNDELDRQVDTDKPVKVVDMEPGVPAAVSVPFATSPETRYIRSPRYRVMFNRIQSPRFTKDVEELRTYQMDIRQVISDNAIKDMLAEEDGKFISVVNNIVGVADRNGAQRGEYAGAGGITRSNLAESLKLLPATSSRLETATALINNISIKDILKFEHDEVGGNLSQEMFLRGFQEREIMGVKFIVTIKQDLVPDIGKGQGAQDGGAASLSAADTIYYFAEPKYTGKFYMLEDATMFMDRRAYMIEFFCYETLGASIGNTNAVARADFDAS